MPMRPARPTALAQTARQLRPDRTIGALAASCSASARKRHLAPLLYGLSSASGPFRGDPISGSSSGHSMESGRVSEHTVPPSAVVSGIPANRCGHRPVMTQRRRV